MMSSLATIRLRQLALLVSMIFFCAASQADLWTTAYYPGYRQSSMPASVVDFSAVTHVIHFAVLPNSDGTLNTTDNTVTTANSTDVVTRAHAAGVKVLICVGGAGSSFSNATTAATLNKFITNLVTLMTNRNYDGIDVDWEPIASGESAQFTSFINGLRTELDKRTPRPLLTAAVATQPSLIGSLQQKFDQINIMTYDLAGAWPGWVTWFNSPLFNGGYRFPSTGGLVPSTDEMVNTFTNAGVPLSKLGIGIPFYAVMWSGGAGTSTGGASLPRQTYTTDPTVTSMSFNTVMTTYYQSNLYRWDSAAQAAYLTIDNSGSSSDKFISYDDEHSCQAKVSFARNRHLGGIMIWELGEGYRSTQPAGQRDPLLQAIKKARATPRIASILHTNQNVTLNFSSLPLAYYRAQWTTNVASGIWNTLTTNLTGTGTNLNVTDTNALNSSAIRIYRVQTPP